MSIKLGVIGYGYWGPNLVRNFIECGGQVTMVSDLRDDRLQLAQARYPGIQTTKSAAEIIASPEIDAVAIATSVKTHYPLALAALKAGKHVFVEKPMTDCVAHAQELMELAGQKGLVLMVDHTFLYTGAVRKIHQLVHAGEIGDLYYFDSSRINLGLFQHDVNVVWDLAVHDLSIMSHLIPFKPRAVSTTGCVNIPGAMENIAFITIFFDEPFIAHITVNWLAPVKVRRTLIGGSKKMIVYDDLEPDEKVKIYDKGIQVSDDPQAIYKTLIGYRTGDMHAPTFDNTEALRLEASTFLNCIQTASQPMNDGRAGLEVVRILEATSRSMLNKGRPEELLR